MRPIEVALLAAEVTVFVLLVAPLPGTVRRLRHLAPLPPALAVAQARATGLAVIFEARR